MCDVISPYELQLHCFTKLVNVWVEVGWVANKIGYLRSEWAGLGLGMWTKGHY